MYTFFLYKKFYIFRNKRRSEHVFSMTTPYIQRENTTLFKRWKLVTRDYVGL